MQQQIPTYQITEANLIYIVWVDELVHTNEHPFCSDLNGCPCHEDSNLVREYITRPLDNGLLSNAEAMRLYWNRQLTPTQDERITDEEIAEIMRSVADNKDADESEQDTHDWLSEHL